MDYKKATMALTVALLLFSGCMGQKQKGYVNGTIRISGYATASNLSSYGVEVGRTFSPPSWSDTGIELSSGGASEVINGTLAWWNTTHVSDGEYTLRLTVTDDRGVSSQDLVYLHVDNNRITSPENGSFLVDNNVLDIQGTVVGANFSGYSLAYLRTDGNWSSNGISLANGGTEKVREGLLGTWDTNGLTHGSYALRLNVSSAGSSTEQENVSLTLSNYQNGWPVSINGTLYSSPAVGDMDGDGDLEIAACSYEGEVYLWNHDGTVLDGWPQNNISSSVNSLKISDIDGDNDMELMVTSYYKLYAWHHDGSLVDGWPKEPENTSSLSSPAVYDLDADGSEEISVATYGELHVWRHNAVAFGDGWPQPIDAYVGAPVLGDLTGDGKLEILMNSGNYLYAWQQNSSPVEGWHPDFSCQSYSNPTLGNIDQDGDLEIAFNAECYDNGTYSYNLFVIHHSGAIVDGWPYNFSSVPVSVEGPLVGDLGNDGVEEIITCSGNSVFVLNGSGSLVSQWEMPGTAASGCYVSLGDLNGDDNPEIFHAVEDKVSALYSNGSLVDGWPKSTSNYVYGEPLVADMDGDSDPEVAVITSDGNVFVWDEEGASGPYEVEWGTARHDNMNSGWYDGDVFNTTVTTSTTTTSTTLPECETKGDMQPCDGKVTSFELLQYIDRWSEGEVSDFDLLEAIDNWLEP